MAQKASSMLMNLNKNVNKPDLQKYEICKDECVRLRDAIDNLKESENKTILLQEAKVKRITALPDLEFDVIKKFKGHNGKIYDSDWSSDCRLLLSGSQDGHLMVWDSITTMKKCTYQLQSASTWVMATSFSPQTKYIACGGLDNICSIYKYYNNDINENVDNDNNNDIDDSKQNKKRLSRFGRRSSNKKTKDEKKNDNGNNNEVAPRAIIRDGPYKSLHHHEGYLSSVKFLNDEKIITASGDSTCILWDVIKKVPESVFLDHAGDVTCVAINKRDSNIFISGSVDATIKLWDIRLSKCVGEFSGHDADADVNDICWYPDNFAFASGSDDATLRMYDIRCYKQLNEYYKDDIATTVTSVSFSSSGRILFAGYDDDPFGIGWDVAYSQPVCKLFHNQSVSSLKVAPNGCAILTSSWDKMLRLWVGK